MNWSQFLVGLGLGLVDIALMIGGSILAGLAITWCIIRLDVWRRGKRPLWPGVPTVVIVCLYGYLDPARTPTELVGYRNYLRRAAELLNRLHAAGDLFAVVLAGGRTAHPDRSEAESAWGYIRRYAPDIFRVSEKEFMATGQLLPTTNEPGALPFVVLEERSKDTLQNICASLVELEVLFRPPMSSAGWSHRLTHLLGSEEIMNRWREAQIRFGRWPRLLVMCDQPRFHRVQELVRQIVRQIDLVDKHGGGFANWRVIALPRLDIHPASKRWKQDLLALWLRLNPQCVRHAVMRFDAREYCGELGRLLRYNG
ncbi:MAG: hypothetical protein V1826_00850 [bacterium]